MAGESNGLLAHLTLDGRFTNRTEEIATQSLGYILSRSDPARAAVEKVVSAGGADVGAIKQVWPEVAGDNGERPDLACFDTNSAKRVLIENKFWAALTPNQPCTYLSSLPSDGKPSVLLFVAPKARIPTLWPELCGRAGTCAALGSRAGARNIKSVAVRGAQTRMMLTSWPHLLGEIAKSGEKALLGDIRQLQVLCRKMDIYAPGKCADLKQIIDDAARLAHNKGYLSTEGLLAVKKEHGYGRYVRMGLAGKPGGGMAWFGANSNLADQHKESLWLMFVRDDVHLDLPEMRRRLIPLYPALDDYFNPGWDGPNVPVHPSTNVDGYEARRDAVVERLAG